MSNLYYFDRFVKNTDTLFSILIPTYNYDVFPLVKELHQQCMNAEIDFEILVNDDASKEFVTGKNLEQQFAHCTVFIQKENKGLSQSRNFLISQAKYEWILLLDSDLLPVNQFFIKRYLKQINTGYQIINGGLKYYDVTPSKEELLRWKYGRKREALSIEKRLETKNKNAFFSSNLLIHKSVFDKVLYDQTLNKYGYEDLVFQKQVNGLNFRVLQIDNPVYHLKLDTSEIFLNKTKQSLQNLSFLIKNNRLDFDDTRISKVYQKTNIPFIKWMIVRLFTIFEERMYNKLKSAKTNLFLFDLYRIGYFAKIF